VIDIIEDNFYDAGSAGFGFSRGGGYVDQK